MDEAKDDWQPISTAPENVVVQTKVDDWSKFRNEQPLMRQGSLWWTPDGKSYVHYRPTHWKPME